MSEKRLNSEKIAEIEKLKQEWMDEAQPYLEKQSGNGNMLDGEDSSVLARIQEKYKKKIKAVIES